MTHRRCDVHVLLSESAKQYHKQCFDSLKDEPISLHPLAGVGGDVAIGRWTAYHNASTEFVSFVDDDDYIIPGIFEKCYQALDLSPEAIGVYTRERWSSSNGHEEVSPRPDLNEHWSKLFFGVHHLVVYRREMIMPYADRIKECKSGSEHYMNLLIMSEGHHFGFVDEVGYVWRVRKNTIRSHGFTEPCRTEASRILQDGIEERERCQSISG